jgi:hypothetical protein
VREFEEKLEKMEEMARKDKIEIAQLKRDAE